MSNKEKKKTGNYERLDYPEIYKKIHAARESKGLVEVSYRKSNWLPQYQNIELSPFYTEQDNIY